MQSSVIINPPTGGRRWEVRIRRADMPTDDADVLIGSFDARADAVDHAATVRAAIDAEAPGPATPVDANDRDLTFEANTCATCSDMVGQHLGYSEATGEQRSVFTPCWKFVDDDGTVSFYCDECAPKPLPAPAVPAPSEIRSVHNITPFRNVIEEHIIAHNELSANVARWDSPSGGVYTAAGTDAAHINMTLFSGNTPDGKTHGVLSLHHVTDVEQNNDLTTKITLANGSTVNINLYREAGTK